jgi:hypothetical protein
MRNVAPKVLRMEHGPASLPEPVERLPDVRRSRGYVLQFHFAARKVVVLYVDDEERSSLHFMPFPP